MSDDYRGSPLPRPSGTWCSLCHVYHENPKNCPKKTKKINAPVTQ